MADVQIPPDAIRSAGAGRCKRWTVVPESAEIEHDENQDEGKADRSVAKKIRVYELARELGVTIPRRLDLCVKLGIGVKSHSSSIDDA